MTFKELGLNERVLKSLDGLNYINPTPIQEKSIPYILKKRDLLGCAQTGTGKTAAFALPIISNLINEQSGDFNRKIKVLILTPTRELALQIRDNFREYGMHTNLKCSVILGGVNQKSQIEVLKKGVDILVATPGRLLDLINQRYVNLDMVNTFVLDEADTMLDMGFIKDVKKIINYIPTSRQTLFFSATMPKEIDELANTILNNYETVKVDPVASTVPQIDQSVYYVDRENKTRLLIDIISNNDIHSMIIFTRTKHGANKLSENLENQGFKCGVIHGNKSQNARVLALKNFKSGQSKILIATDIAARGIDIKELSHVVNYEMPEQAETYVHRIGRTGRAGKQGIAISLCDYSEVSSLLSIERLIKKELLIVSDHKYPMVKKDVKVTSNRNSKNNSRTSSMNNNKKRNDNNSQNKQAPVNNEKNRSFKDSRESSNNKRSFNYSKNNRFSNKKSYR